MEYDNTNLELQRIARDVFARIPEEAQGLIESSCDRITFAVNGDCEAEFLPAEREIRVIVSRIDDFSESGKRGILAHEFGHAFVHAQTTLQPGAAHETLANMFPQQQWGFFSEIAEMKTETARLRIQSGRHDA